MEQNKVFFEKSWALVQQTLDKLKRIPNGVAAEPPITSAESMKVYTIIYDLCTINTIPCAEKLYTKYSQFLEEYILQDVMPCLRETQDAFMLSQLLQQWEKFKVLGRWLHRTFFYLDRYYISRNSMKSLPTLQQVNKNTFRRLVYEERNARVRDIVISFIDKEREGEKIDRDLLKKVLEFFVEMGELDLDCYMQDFEEHMVNDTGYYYSRKASSWVMEYSCPCYLVKVEECLKKVKDRVAHYLHSSSETKLIERVQHELLIVHHNHLLENEQSGYRVLLKEESTEDLSTMFRLFREIPQGLEPMAEIFKQHISEASTALIQQVDKAASNQRAEEEVHACFWKIIELHDKYMEYIKGCFADHKLFHTALTDAFEVFFNKSIAGATSVELMATFCDNFIRKSEVQKLSDEAVEETLEKLVKLLVYFNEKDLFVEFFRKKLARRLLFDKTGNKDFDQSFVTKLKHKFGGHFTSKMEGMLTDVMIAKENQTSLENWFGSNPSEKPKFDLSVTILTTGFWPCYKSSDLNLPLEMVKGMEAFKKFYQTKTNHRKLTWIHSLGNCNINAKFEKKTIELIVSAYQASALLLFNETDRLSFSEIMTQLNLSRDDAVRVLHSLTCAKYKILNKEPKTKTISETDAFEFNTNFFDKMRTIRIPLPPVDERKKITEDVDKDRRHNIDAAVVRIMKGRKVMDYQQLISECIDMLSKTFKPGVKAIKKRIEDLIIRDFLERDSQNPNLFKYLP